MSALENAKNMSVEDILAKTAASGLLEFGVERSVVTEKWNQVKMQNENFRRIRSVWLQV